MTSSMPVPAAGPGSVASARIPTQRDGSGPPPARATWASREPLDDHSARDRGCRARVRTVRRVHIDHRRPRDVLHPVDDGEHVEPPGRLRRTRVDRPAGVHRAGCVRGPAVQRLGCPALRRGGRRGRGLCGDRGADVAARVPATWRLLRGRDVGHRRGVPPSRGAGRVIRRRQRALADDAVRHRRQRARGADLLGRARRDRADVAACYLLLRSRLGLALTAIRDDETAAGSVGVHGRRREADRLPRRGGRGWRRRWAAHRRVH